MKQNSTQLIVAGLLIFTGGIIVGNNILQTPTHPFISSFFEGTSDQSALALNATRVVAPVKAIPSSPTSNDTSSSLPPIVLPGHDSLSRTHNILSATHRTPTTTEFPDGSYHFNDSSTWYPQAPQPQNVAATVSNTSPASSQKETVPLKLTGLSQTSTGVSVSILQTILKSEGLFPADTDITTYFGPITTEALKKFQRAHGISPSGAVDTATDAALANTSATNSNTSFGIPPFPGESHEATSQTNYPTDHDASTHFFNPYHAVDTHFNSVPIRTFHTEDTRYNTRNGHPPVHLIDTSYDFYHDATTLYYALPDPTPIQQNS